MNERKTLIATDGKILTNGEIFGRRILLAVDLNESDFHEITEEEHNKILEENTETMGL